MEKRKAVDLKFEKQLKELKIELSEKQLHQLSEYYELLIQWNKVMNLTGLTEYEDVYEKHFLDSLSLIKVIDLQKTKKVIDIGTGAGFPGIPIKIAYPHLQITLLDSLKKRIGFLNEVVKKLGLEKVETIHGRAEDFAKDKQYRESYDLGVSRAVADLSVLSEYCLPYVKVGGSFISYKSDAAEEEIEKSEPAIQTLGGKIEKVVKFQLPETKIGRSFVRIDKIEATPDKYPRKAGVPLKKPLK